MYLYKQKRKNGDLYLAIKEKYYVPGTGTREYTVESIGCLSKLKHLYDDPIAHFTRYAEELTQKEKEENSASISIDLSEKLATGTNDTRNVGYGVLKSLYKELELDKFWNWKTRGLSVRYSTDQIFRLLTISRALNPGSKKYTLENQDFYFEPFDGISLDDIYHALDIIATNQNDLQKWIFDHSKKVCCRDISTSYFDCTNYYFDISHPDIDDLNDEGNPVDENGNPTPPKYRKRGPEKNHRPDPIIEMGLLMDKNGIPIAYDIFPGNESEKIHMRPIINRVKNEFEDCRIIFVADRGLNTSDNIYWLNGDNKAEHNSRDGYYSIVTSELEMSDDEIRKTYRGLAKIEDSFKVTKTCFKSRPIYVRTTEHIDAHFATCFLALVLIRLLEHKLDHAFPTEKILESIKKYNCTHLDTNRWQFTYYDKIMEACGKAFEMELDKKYRTQQEIQRLLRY